MMETFSQVQTTRVFWRKIKQQMRLEGILEKRPKKQISLNPKQDHDLNVDLQKVQAWSQDNKALYNLVKKHGFATFICNKQFIYEHYTKLVLNQSLITKIQQQVKRFKNVYHLNLSFNNIAVLQNIPQNVVQLVVSHNRIHNINIISNKIQYLDLSNNQLGDESLLIVKNNFKELRHLNLGGNNICKIEQVFVLKDALFLKSLVLVSNPISLLKHYYKTVTDNLVLTYFDNSKYVKQEKKPISKIVQPPPPVPDNKNKKDTKKETKKDAKKQTKKEPQPQVIVQPVIQQQKIQNINESIFNFSIDVISNLPVPKLQPQNCPNYDENPQKYLPNYWIQYTKPHSQKISTKQRKIYKATTQNNKTRLTFEENIKETFTPNVNLRDYFINGTIIKVFVEQPKIIIDSVNGDKTPEIVDNIVLKQQTCIGVIFISLQKLLEDKDKKIQYRYRIFPEEAQLLVQFAFPLQDQDELILKNKQKLQQAKLQKQKQKQLQLQGQLNKKQGKKDSKKLDKKPPPKKGEKTQQDKLIQPSSFSLHPRTYIYKSDNHIIQATDYELSVSISIQ